MIKRYIFLVIIAAIITFAGFSFFWDDAINFFVVEDSNKQELSWDPEDFMRVARLTVMEGSINFNHYNYDESYPLDYESFANEVRKPKRLEPPTEDPFLNDDQYKYVPGNCVNNFCSNFVLGVKLSDGNHALLNKDIDGIVFGLDCSDGLNAMYCITGGF